MATHSTYKVIGVMSGSSLDGVDLAYCTFIHNGNAWQFSIHQVACIPYSEDWTTRLRTARSLDGRALWKLHADYGHLLGSLIKEFISDFGLIGQVDLISSHGHTIFHFPGEKFTTQIGDGASIAATTGMPVVCDLRASDVALGGNGAPIVPIGDLHLFPEYNYLLNIGGIANVTVKKENNVLAYDICTANQVLNHYAALKGMDYDADGQLAAAGKVNASLLSALNALDYYSKPFPKSLDNGMTIDVLIPLIDSHLISIEDKLHTYCEHIALQVVDHIGKPNSTISPDEKLLVTGGGAFNKHLVTRIRAISQIPITIPTDTIVSYKEALVMAFIGVLRIRGEANVLGAVTGASRDSIGGALYHP